MTQSTTTTTKKAKAIVLHEQDIKHIPAESFADPSVGGRVSWKTLLSQPGTQSDTFTVGIATCPPAESVSCPGAAGAAAITTAGGDLKLHRHTHAEIYYVIDGRGVVTVDGVEHDVGKGGVVFIPGNAEHGMRCVGRDPVKWLYVFAADGFGEIVYRFSEQKRVVAKL